MLLRYTYINYPEQGVIVCPQCPVDFTFDHVRTAAHEVAEGPYWKQPRAPGAPIVNTWKRHHPHRLVDWLAAQPPGDDVVEPGKSEWRCWAHVAWHAVAQWQFLRAYCCVCDKPFSPSRVMRAWHEVYRSPRDGWGGWRCFCPARHLLFSVTEWVA